MKRLIILVEGDSEIILMKKLVIPYLYQELYSHELCAVEWSIEAVKITTNKKLNKKGGNIRYDYLMNDVKRFASQNCTLITTFFDFFRLPVDFPGNGRERGNVNDLENAIYLSMSNSVQNLPEFIPYIQMYEFEALLFSDIKVFEWVVDDDSALREIREIMDSYENPEEINGGMTTAPSKRLIGIFNYDKTADSDLMLGKLGLDVIKSKCPRFRGWLDTLRDRLITLSSI